MAVRLDADADGFSRTTGLPGITSFTMMGWFQPIVDENDETPLLFYGDSSPYPAHFYSMGMGSDGVTLSLWNGTADAGSVVLTMGTWYHIAFTVAGTGANQALGYVNGVLEMTNNGSASVTNERIAIGDNNETSEFLNGNVAAVKIWAAVLSAAEIANEMRQYLPVRTANLNTFSPMLTTADDEIDYSGNGNTWTVGGTLATVDGPPIPWKAGRRHVLIPAAAAPGGLSIPIAAYHYNHHLGSMAS